MRNSTEDQDSRMIRRLRELAWEYHVRCESHDQGVCTRRSANGIAIPSNLSEFRLVHAFAVSTLRDLTSQLAKEFDRPGVDLSQLLRKEIGDAVHEFEVQWRKDRGRVNEALS